MSLDLRIADEKDRPAIEALVNAAYGHYVARVGQRPGPMLDDYGALIADRHVHVIDGDGMLQGLVVLIPEPDTMLLDNVAVDPARRGTGLGRRLMLFAEREARDAGFTSLRLYTHEKMTENIALYTRIGYRETDRREERGLRRVYMMKRLA